MQRSRSERKAVRDVLPVVCALVLLGIAAAALCAQSEKPTAQSPSPASQQQPAPKTDANPFPEDTGHVPVMPNTPAALEAADGTGNDTADALPVELPLSDSDPVHSPDDPAPSDSGAVDSATSYSSSHAGLDGILPDPNAPDSGNHRSRHQAKEPPPHQETAAEDLSVGNYYLDKKNWRAALSRFQSAMVLSPEEPEVYWGIAESQRHLGNLAEARANYQKLLDYDPGSRHAKDAAKALKLPAIANATPAAAPAK